MSRDKSNGAATFHLTSVKTLIRSEMKRHCHRCGTVLGLSKVRCPYCRESGMSWLHIVLITAFGAMILFYILKVM
jgi:uncharacterized OB-fold protein